MKLEILYLERNICWACFENRVLWKIFEPQSDNVIGDSIASFMICTPYQIFFRWWNQEEWVLRGMWHLWGRRELYRDFGVTVWRERPLGKPRRRSESMDLQETGCVVWSGLIWLRMRTSGRLLWTRQWTFVLHKRRGISWLAEEVLASHEMTLLHGQSDLVSLLFVCLFGWLVWLVSFFVSRDL
jgi:hypothetical protein